MRFALLTLCALTFVSPVVGCAAPPSVTLAAYDKVMVGMTYDEVVAATGTQGKELSRLERDGESSVQYRWENADGSNFVARFENGKLANKVQSGLR